MGEIACKGTKVFDRFVLCVVGPHKLKLGINDVRGSLDVLCIAMLYRGLSAMSVCCASSNDNKHTDARRELIVLSASTIRSDLRQRFANLIHIVLSSSGADTSVLTCKTRCHVSTSG